MPGEPVLTNEPQNIAEWTKLHESYRQSLYDYDSRMDKVLTQKFSDKIRDLMLKIYPEAQENLEQMIFTFVDVSFLILSARLKNQSSEDSLVISVNTLNPLRVESLFFVPQHAFEHKTFTFESFVLFLEKFDPKTLTNPPPKQYLHVLSKMVCRKCELENCNQ